jgi:hypothetical protein
MAGMHHSEENIIRCVDEDWTALKAMRTLFDKLL